MITPIRLDLAMHTPSQRTAIDFPRSSPRLISILIPVYNEAANIGPLVTLLSQVKFPLPTEWIFIDDHSKDNSYELLKNIKGCVSNLKCLRRPQNLGKGAAIRSGIEIASGDIIVIQDCDLECNPHDLPKLIDPIVNGEADVVYGSRFKSKNHRINRIWHRYGNRLLTAFSNLCSGMCVTDMETCYKIFRADILKNFRLTSNRFGFEPEVTAYVAKFNFRVTEYPISYFPRTHREGKKIGWKDAIAALWFIFKFNFLVDQAQCLKRPL